jgi:hypothetical protein
MYVYSSARATEKTKYFWAVHMNTPVYNYFETFCPHYICNFDMKGWRPTGRDTRKKGNKYKNIEEVA